MKKWKWQQKCDEETFDIQKSLLPLGLTLCVTNKGFHFSCTMLPVKAVREAVITTLIEWHDKFLSIIYSKLGIRASSRSCASVTIIAIRASGEIRILSSFITIFSTFLPEM